MKNTGKNPEKGHFSKYLALYLAYGIPLLIVTILRMTITIPGCLPYYCKNFSHELIINIILWILPISMLVLGVKSKTQENEEKVYALIAWIVIVLSVVSIPGGGSSFIGIELIRLILISAISFLIGEKFGNKIYEFFLFIFLYAVLHIYLIIIALSAPGSMNAIW